METAELGEVASLPVERKKIQLIISDIEGCLNLDEKTYDLDALSWIRSANQLARQDNPIPYITVCSGRQHAFVEAIAQLIAGTFPAVFENGCGMYFPTRRLHEEYAWHPHLCQPERRVAFEQVRQYLLEEIIGQEEARRVPGKEVMLSLHPIPPATVGGVYNHVREALSQRHLAASVTRSASAVDITPAGIDKAAGVQWLVDTVDETFSIKLANVAGIGDSIGDLSSLQ